MVVKLTKEQADYLKTFGTDKSKAFYYISRWGWNYPLEDGYEKVYETTKEQPFEQFNEKEKMLELIKKKQGGGRSKKMETPKNDRKNMRKGPKIFNK